MSTYRYNKDDNTVSPFMKNYVRDASGYSCKEVKDKSTRIPISGEHKWNECDVLTEGVDFESVYQKNILFSDGDPAWKNISKEQYENTTTLKRIIAIPIEVKEGKEEEIEDKMWEEVRNILYKSNGSLTDFNLDILNKIFTITRK